MATGHFAVHRGPATSPDGRPPLTAPKLPAKTFISPNFNSAALFTPYSSPRTDVLRAGQCSELVRPSYGKPDPWGTPSATYGGLGTVTKELESTTLSRSHRHYGTGCTNYYAPWQPYDVTTLTLSECRPWDQLLPKPLHSDRIEHCQLQNQYPKEGPYTSHESKFGVFPGASYNPSSQNHKGLSTQTVQALRQIHHGIYNTSTYNQHFNPHSFGCKKSNSDSHHRRRSKHIDVGEGCKSKYKMESNTSSSVVTNTDIQTSKDFLGDTDSEKSSEPATKLQSDEQVNSDSAQDSDSAILVRDSCDLAQVTEPENISADTDSDTPIEEDGNEVKEELLKAEPSHNNQLGYVTFTHLSELPQHFRRVSCKYTRNLLSSGQCSVPYYLVHSHTLLPSTVTKLPNTSQTTGADLATGRKRTARIKTESNSCKDSGSLALPDISYSGVCPHSCSPGVAHTSTNSARGRLYDSSNPGVAKGNMEKAEGDFKLPQLRGTIHGDVDTTRSLSHGTPADGGETLGDSETMIPSLYSPLVSSESRVPQRLGLKYKSEAHKRFHQVYLEKVPDLREVQMTRRHTTQQLYR